MEQKVNMCVLPAPTLTKGNVVETGRGIHGNPLKKLGIAIMMAWRLWKMWIPPVWLIFCFIMPIGMFTVFGLNKDYSNLPAGQVTVAALVMCNMAQYSVFTISASIAARVGVESANGWIQQLKATSISINTYHVSRILAIVVISALQTAAVYIFGAFEGVQMTTKPLVFSCLALLATVIFSALIGLSIGAIMKSDAASSVVGSSSWLISMFSGMYMPLDSLGDFFVKLGYYMPMWGMNQLLRAGLAGDTALIDFKVCLNIFLWAIILLFALYLGNKRAVRR